MPFRQSVCIAYGGMTWYAWVLVVLYALAPVGHFAMIGRPREPFTLTSACWSVVINAACALAVIALALRCEGGS